MRLNGANVRIALNVGASMDNDTPVNIVRTVNENRRTLRVEGFGSEDG